MVLTCFHLSIGWIYKFIDWTFSHVKADCGADAECILAANNQVSSILNLNGYACFAVPLIPLIPALIMKVIGKVLESQVYVKSFLFIIITWTSCSLSFNLKLCEDAKTSPINKNIHSYNNDVLISNKFVRKNFHNYIVEMNHILKMFLIYC